MDSGEFRFRCFSLFLPVVGSVVGLAFAYSLVNWFLVAGTGYLPLDEQLVDDWLPLAIAVVLVIARIAPAINKLRFNSKRNGPALYVSAAIAVIAIPTIVAQNYVVRASGTLTHVADATQIASRAASKYYTADTICLDHGNALVQTAFETVGSRNDTLVFHIYAAAPLCGEDIRGSRQKTVWIGVAFREGVNNRLSVADKQAKFQEFANRSQQEFNLQDGSHYRYYQVAPRSAERRNLISALAKRASADNAIFLIPHAEPFEQRTGSWLEWTFISLGIGALTWLAMVAFPKIDAKKFATPKSPSKVRLAGHDIGWWTFFVPSRQFWGLPALLDVNIAVYLVMAFSGLGVVSFQNNDLIAWGANYGPLLHGMGFLRLVSSQFVHAGFMHVAQNMYGLLIAGFLLLPVLRNWGLVTSYLACGLAGGIVSAVVHPDVFSVGASGAIMGLWGAVLVLALFNDPRISQGRTFILANGAIFVGLTLVTGIAQLGIDNAAHLGGVGLGAIIGAASLMSRHPTAVRGHHDERAAPATITDLRQPRPEVRSSD
jgi:membrane associated rhomboid family serine protease